MNGTGDFAIIRKEELELIQTLKPRARPRAMALIASIRFIHCGAQTVALGDRDFAEFGLGREAASRALKDLESIGVLQMLEKGGLIGRGHKSKYRVPFARRNGNEAAGKPDSCGRENRPFPKKAAGKPAINGRETRPFKEKTAGKPDTTKETSSTSSQKSKEEEVSSCELDQEVERQASMVALRERIRRVEAAANAIGITIWPFMHAAGSPEAADFLAKMFLCRKINQSQLQKNLRNAKQARQCK